MVVLTALYAIPSFASAIRVLYVLPIWLATRMGGRRSGLFVVILGTFAGGLVEWRLGHSPTDSLATNLVMRFAALTLLMLLIAHVEHALQKHQRLALTDPLTGLMNRHALKEFSGRAFHRAMVRDLPITVVVIDCDGFKVLNDTYGHKAGDDVLNLLARSLEDQTRRSDLVARIGGDEFAVVLQDTQLEEARQIMSRVDSGFTLAARNAGYEVGLSIGYGAAGAECFELDCAIDRADRSMYEHKQRKRAAAFLN
jgi:diguanylate cyclase (GGDEF)-like protein